MLGPRSIEANGTIPQNGGPRIADAMTDEHRATNRPERKVRDEMGHP
jgi:hypothetical protein